MTYLIYVYCDVAVPTRVHPPRKSWRGASRAAAPEKDCESRIEISGGTSYCYKFASLLIVFIFFIYYFVRRATRRYTTRRGRRRSLFTTPGTTLTASDSRTEIAPEEQDRAKTRVELTPRNKTKEEQRKPKRLSRTGIGATLRGPKTDDRHKRRPPTAGSLRFWFSNYRGHYGPRYGVVAGRIDISRVATLLAANPRTPARRIDAAIDPRSRDPGRYSGAVALSEK